MGKWWSGSLVSAKLRWLLWLDLADEEGDGHFLAAIDSKANFVLTHLGDLQALDIDDDSGAGGGCAGGDLDIDLLGRGRRLKGIAIGINDGKFDFLHAFFDFLKAELANDVAIDADGKLGEQDDIGGAKDVEFALCAGAGSKAKSEDFCRHPVRVREKGSGKKEKVLQANGSF
jgi:hypothetical protein